MPRERLSGTMRKKGRTEARLKHRLNRLPATTPQDARRPVRTFTPEDPNGPLTDAEECKLRIETPPAFAETLLKIEITFTSRLRELPQYRRRWCERVPIELLFIKALVIRENNRRFEFYDRV